MSRRIYLVDDDPIFLYLIKKIIGTVDPTIETESFADGDLAINQISGIATETAMLPDFIFLDLNMPVLDGWGFLSQYGQIHSQLSKRIVLYIISSTISPAEIERAADYPFISGHIIKPPEKSRISDILQIQPTNTL